MAKKMQFTPGSKPLMTILNDITNVNTGGLDLQPKYQRGYVWNSDFKNKLIYSLVKSYPIGSISLRALNTPNDKGAETEVVDGQQRLTTIRDFVNNSLVIRGEFSQKILLELRENLISISKNDKSAQKLLKKLDNKNGFSLKYSDLPEIIKNNILAYPLALISISNSEDKDITEYFNFLQNQEILRAGEIINSIPQTILEKYLNRLSNKDKLLENLGFVDNRKEFEKIFYSIVGLFDKSISFGTTDKEIQNYVANKKNDLTDLPLKLTENMIKNLNIISQAENLKKYSANKRFLKLLLLLAGFNLIDFDKMLSINLSKLNTINTMLSSFNSAKKGIVEETFKNFSKEEIEEYRLIALFTKGAQSYDNALNRCKVLASKINTDSKILD